MEIKLKIKIKIHFGDADLPGQRRKQMSRQKKQATNEEEILNKVFFHNKSETCVAMYIIFWM